jgi:hypothetical protein
MSNFELYYLVIAPGFALLVCGIAPWASRFIP